jgi:hypothetical protein
MIHPLVKRHDLRDLRLGDWWKGTTTINHRRGTIGNRRQGRRRSDDRRGSIKGRLKDHRQRRGKKSHERNHEKIVRGGKHSFVKHGLIGIQNETTETGGTKKNRNTLCMESTFGNNSRSSGRNQGDATEKGTQMKEMGGNSVRGVTKFNGDRRGPQIDEGRAGEATPATGGKWGDSHRCPACR